MPVSILTDAVIQPEAARIGVNGVTLIQIQNDGGLHRSHNAVTQATVGNALLLRRRRQVWNHAGSVTGDGQGRFRRKGRKF